jgi:ATP-dependent helicase Lhr and Lhr-like helicase
VFPDQVACAENLTGPRELPDHPLVNQTLNDCLNEAMDIRGLELLLTRIEDGSLTCIARDLSEPSPFAHELLNARPYAFLDDAPLEERRTQAVSQRRWLDPASARDLGALDEAAIANVVEQCRLDARDEHELHDALLLSAHPASERFAVLFARLVAGGRALALQLGSVTLWIATERVAMWRLVVPDAVFALEQPASVPCTLDSRESALREVVRGRLEVVGPTSAGELAASLGLSSDDIDVALALLESEGFVMRGRFRAHGTELEWCERRLLARIHRATLERLRREIEPVSPAVFMRFLVEHQHAAPGTQLHGAEGLFASIEQLSGFDLAAGAWEEHVLPRRVRDFCPALLDQLSFSGRVAWARAAENREGRAEGPIRSTPIALFVREQLAALRGALAAPGELSLCAQKVLAHLQARGACFVQDVAKMTALSPIEVDGALAELAAWGLVTSDGFSGLRALLANGPRSQAGRYALVEGAAARDLELVARTLLKRWGVLFRKLVERESRGVAWGQLVRVLRELEARGELRGGRFVSGFSGEQYALPDSISLLRQLRREARRNELVTICACDPLNLVGLITPGPRIPQVSSSRILLRDGLPVMALVAGQAKPLADLTDSEQLECERVLRGILSLPAAVA